MHRFVLRIAATLLALAPTVAFAHPGHEGAGLISGFMHPLGGVDHIIAMVAVGLLAARIGGRALSVVVLGMVAVFGVAIPIAAAMGLVAFFAIFHGYAHGIEMPETVSGLAYGAGFVAATAMLHGIGIGLGLALGGVRVRAAPN